MAHRPMRFPAGLGLVRGLTTSPWTSGARLVIPRSERLGLRPDDATAIRNWAANLTLEQLPVKRFEVTFQRSRGPGGQNVNKVNTKVDMRLQLDKATWIPQFVRDTLRHKESGRINKSGELVVTSDRTRSQAQNIQDCLQKIHTMLVQAAYIPPEPEQGKLDKIAQRHTAANEKRKFGKSKRALVKQGRRLGRDD
ncbi:hypothetical protein H4R35_001906 [Dimargaris xerosporica]|nr:hypothetical protein H4R35_001906 [Dimargaris xerosporica]